MQNFIADVLIGNFIMGNQLKIRNAANTITLDESGILIKVTRPEGDDETVFQADTTGNVMLKGKIYATSGAIGGLTIAENGIGVESEEGEFALVFDENGISSSNESFSLTADGVLTAKSGTIGGLTLSENSISASNGFFSVTSAGYLTAKSGTIGGFTIGKTALYNGINSMTASGTGVYLGTDGLNLGGKFKVTNEGSVQIGEKKVDDSDSMIAIGDGTRLATLTPAIIALFHGYKSGLDADGSVQLWANAAVLTGVIISEGSTGLTLGVQSGITRIYQADNTDLNIGNATGRGTLLGTWYYDGDTIKSSDKKIKNSIEEIDDRYSLLFDNLKPVRYKYNAGTSDRFHTGLIAQDVKDAIVKAGLSTKDFAAYAEWEADSHDKASCGIRYEELIPLCIAEIQKLKRRM